MNALILGLSQNQLSEVLLKLTKAESIVLRTENAAPSIVIHPFMLITAILDRFSEEDGMFINKSIDNLKLLQQKISDNDALSMGNLSIELNQLSSDLRAIQMGNVYMQNLARVILASRCTVKNHTRPWNCSLPELKEEWRFAVHDWCPPPHVDGKLDPNQISDPNQFRDPFPVDAYPVGAWYSLKGQFTRIVHDLEALGTRCEGRKFDIECLQKQIDINLNVVSANPHKLPRYKT